MWYKLKRILIYPDGVTEKQVYPAPYQYSYDFRDKSTTILTNDGWTISSTSGMSFNSDWIYLNGAYTPNIHRDLWVSLNDAKYIKYIMNWKFIWDAGMWCTLITRVGTDDNTQNWLANNKNSSVASVWWYIQGTRTFKQNISAWNYVQSLKFDLENKTMLLDVNWNTYTWTLTDANVTALKTNNNLKLYLWQYPSTTPQVYVSSIWIEVWL